jgi:hypothetical protein
MPLEGKEIAEADGDPLLMHLVMATRFPRHD